jgi:hypothetical protein
VEGKMRSKYNVMKRKLKEQEKERTQGKKMGK